MTRGVRLSIRAVGVGLVAAVVSTWSGIGLDVFALAGLAIEMARNPIGRLPWEKAVDRRTA